jgi:hypothetical protein
MLQTASFSLSRKLRSKQVDVFVELSKGFDSKEPNQPIRKNMDTLMAKTALSASRVMEHIRGLVTNLVDWKDADSSGAFALLSCVTMSQGGISMCFPPPLQLVLSHEVLKSRLLDSMYTMSEVTTLHDRSERILELLEEGLLWPGRQSQWITIDNLRAQLEVNPNMYPTYGHLNKRVLKPAIHKLAKKDIQILVSIRKKGTVVEQVQFERTLPGVQGLPANPLVDKALSEERATPSPSPSPSSSVKPVSTHTERRMCAMQLEKLWASHNTFSEATANTSDFSKLLDDVLLKFPEIDLPQATEAIRSAMVSAHSNGDGNLAGEVLVPGYFIRHKRGQQYLTLAIEKVKQSPAI